MKELIRLGGTLMIICLLAGAGLAAVYAQTKPVIDERAQEDLLNAAKEAIPGAVEVVESESDGKVYWTGKSGDQVVGYAMNVDAWGFGKNEPIRMMVGVDENGKVTAVKVISAAETPGIGMRIKDEGFLSKFVGVDNPMAVDSITGATVSSSAVKNGVSTAAEFLAAVSGANQPPAPIDLAQVPDGTYEGSGQGLMGEIKVKVTVEGGKITEVKVVSHQETSGIADPAIKGVPEAMVRDQKVEVDTVSGATFTSKGIVEAVKNALAATQKAPAGPKGIDLASTPDGTYEGTGQGLMGEIKVQVTVEGGKITAVKVVSQSETPGIADPAIKGVPEAIVRDQKVDVDAVSGATFTSKGIVGAVKNALEAAQK